MKQLTAIKGHTYGGKFHRPGDVYEARESDANLMVLVKNSEYCAAEPVAVTEKPKRTYTRKNQTAEKPSGYKTKDMKAS
jgi:hypothetical protein